MAGSNKTEQPTQRRLQQARRDGQFPLGREFVSASAFLVLVALLSNSVPCWLDRMETDLKRWLALAFRPDPDLTLVAAVARKAVWDYSPGVVGACLLLLGCILAVQLAVTGLGISGSKLAPDFARLNFAARLKDLPSQNLAALFQALLFLPVLGLALWAVIGDNLGDYERLSLIDVGTGAARVAQSLHRLLWSGGEILLALGFIDLLRQRRRFFDQLRMTKQEVREESKEQEGNPQIKQRIRRLQRDAARRSMMKAVPTATAVIVNPTHYSVAIRYEMESQRAPRVVAKGKNYLALRIRQRAVEHQIPIVENQPLAQALYQSVDVGQEIPAHLYRAVAEILAYIYRLMNRRL